MPVFSNDRAAKNAVQKVTLAITLLDAIDADPACRTVAIAAVRKAFP